MCCGLAVEAQTNEPLVIHGCNPARTVILDFCQMMSLSFCIAQKSSQKANDDDDDDDRNDTPTDDEQRQQQGAEASHQDCDARSTRPCGSLWYLPRGRCRC